MKKIVLLCASGMSTSMLVKKMQEAAKVENFACEIAAYSAAEAVEKASDADVVLLGPQVFLKIKSLPNCQAFLLMLLICACTDAWTVKVRWLLLKN